MTAVVVTGASGFVGKALCAELLARGYSVRAAVRSVSSISDAAGLEVFASGEVGAATDWSEILDSRYRGNDDEGSVEEAHPADCVIHCAARAHVMRETEADSLAAYRTVNVAGTQRLAEQAATLGVRRFVFLSSIGVNGVFTNEAHRFECDDVPAPSENYAISKWEAEQVLWEISAKTGLEVVVVRPPLVYGPGAKGNVLRLLSMVASGVPLPLGAVNNRRSLVGLDNLVDLLIRCVDHPAAAGQVLLVSDGQDLSTSGLIRLLAQAMGKPSRLVPVPVLLLRAAGLLVGKASQMGRLVRSLQVDSNHTCELLGWNPPVSVDEGLQKTADWFLSQQ